MNGLRKMILCLVAGVFLVWTTLHLGMLAGDENGKIRVVLGVLFALIILARPKHREPAGPLPGWAVPVAALLGTGLTLGGLIFGVGQFEWLGLIILLAAALLWALGERFLGDIRRAFFVVYWIHPLPGQLFAKFQLLMQVVSTRASEWLLHCFNVRVWADGIMLHTGFQTFLVPESCSGMVTAVTVLMSVLGIGILFRFRWLVTLAFLLLGTVQVLVLNILRISFMVIWSVRMPPEWAGTFLHDTLGFLLFAAILLVQAEAVWWRKYSTALVVQERGIEAGDVEEAEKATILPRFWRVVKRWGFSALVVLLLAGCVAVAVYKRRPAHRAVMIGEVVDGLKEHNLEQAERGVNAALSLRPGDRGFLSTRIHIKVLRGKYAEALAELETLEGPLSTMETVMKSCSLMSLHHADEAMALIEALPESEKRNPGVAMIRAEYAMDRNRPAVVAANVVIAATSPTLINRIRTLFPYLWEHKQWRAIMLSDNETVPYKECAHALIAVYANIEMNNIFRASKALKAGLAAWPNDARFIGSLFLLAARRPGSEWENLFADNIKANAGNLDADRLASYIDYCFKLSRPDLAWLLYLRLRAFDPQDPALYLTPAQFGEVWFTFRRHGLGIEADSGNLRIDFRPLYRQTRDLEPFRSFWKQVPLAEDLAGVDFGAKRAALLDSGLTEIEKRESTGKISRRMRMAYPGALIMAGRFKEAENSLNRLEKMYPDAGKELLYQRAVYYDQQGQWQNSYETIIKYCGVAGEGDNLMADLMMVRALVNMNMGVSAMEVVEQAREAFPDSSAAAMAEASIWDIFGFKEQALFLLSRRGDELSNSRVTAQLLYDIGCFRESEKLTRVTGGDVSRSRSSEKQGLFPFPAEWTVQRRWPVALSPAELEKEAGQCQESSDRSVSPFVRNLMALMAEWQRSGGGDRVSDPARWGAVGRNDVEKVGALHHLIMLQARQKMYPQAVKNTEEALRLAPRSAILWRTLIALTEGDKEVVRRALTACPNDPDIWLASLVIRVKNEGGKGWLQAEIDNAVSSKRFSPGTMVRAGEFLLRKGFVDLAVSVAHAAIERCRGALPAFVLGLNCALTVKDMKWAMSCALRAVENSRDPGLFHRVVVDLKAQGKVIDNDLVTALEYLKEHSPKETQWAERLGGVYFQKGDLKRAMSVLDEVTAGSLKGLKVRSLLLAAEAARQEGEYVKAIGILESAYALYPETTSILNNLVYNLVRDNPNPVNLARAKDLLPKLVEMGGTLPVVLDTVAMVYLKIGDLAKADEFSKKARAMVDRDDYAVLELDLNAAEIMYKRGELKEAREILEKLRLASGRSQFVDLSVKDLLHMIEKESTHR